jgi:transposase
LSDEKELIPVEIFRDRTLSVLEIISEYLKEDKGLSYHEIAELLNRNDRTIWTCVNRAKKKRTEVKPEVKPEGIVVPSEIFKDRTLSVLEIITEFFKEEKGMSYHEIAEMLNRDDRTIWTCYDRAKKKRKAKEVAQ